MKNLFIPYNLALLAKEKGFDEPCLAFYSQPELSKETVLCWENEGSILGPDIGPFKNFDGFPLYDTKIVTAPLYQQIVDWFREEHIIDIYYIPPIGWQIQLYDKPLTTKTFEGEYYEALEKTIEEAFKLIKQPD